MPMPSDDGKKTKSTDSLSGRSSGAYIYQNRAKREAREVSKWAAFGVPLVEVGGALG